MELRRSETEHHHLNLAGLQGPLEFPHLAVPCCYPIAGTLPRAQKVASFITLMTVDCTAAFSRGGRCARNQRSAIQSTSHLSCWSRNVLQAHFSGPVRLQESRSPLRPGRVSQPVFDASSVFEAKAPSWWTRHQPVVACAISAGTTCRPP